ncbi:class I SAM-dependent methyltransferase [Bradyrhizobium vignae]|uniref:class I SAM-dependent methyltransferase n=1 Tax=Bradyrhizobium vignae TaxID=1549949 RepID=UPI00100C0A68|nr:class I SAM-dependent methyltransferase [Bradyrhizobium vignae]RXH00385.1 class I SAM-dependent methyltransferase [Bradyrhizobium vignae]
MTKDNGGYDDGYSSSDCFWGASPGSLVQSFLEESPDLSGVRVLDLGCGEGKNAAAFACRGASVTAVDCSAKAIENGRRAFQDPRIEWLVLDARAYLTRDELFDVIVLYGLAHCLSSPEDISSLIQTALQRTRPGGYHFLVSFNDGPHDLSAHPNFSPTLLPHSFYVDQYESHAILTESDSIIYETHPHNNIPHFHSLTRLLVKKVL